MDYLWQYIARSHPGFCTGLWLAIHDRSGISCWKHLHFILYSYLMKRLNAHSSSSLCSSHLFTPGLSPSFTFLRRQSQTSTSQGSVPKYPSAHPWSTTLTVHNAVLFFLCTKTNIKFKSNRKCILAMTSLHYNKTGQCDVYWTPH